jgi:sortase A
MGIIGELLITIGVVLLLFVAYQLWWTNVEATRAANEAAAQLQESWQRPPGQDEPGTDPDEEYVEPEFGSAFALMYIPRLSDKVWGTPVLGGVQEAQLAQGIGHYPETALPGQEGNFAVAAHRATNGEPFRDIDRLQVGDEVYVETRDEWLVYRLQRDQIVTPQDVWVIDPVPGEPGASPTEALLTLTTCNPRWASTTRWIWWGTLQERIDKQTGQPPDAILAGR